MLTIHKDDAVEVAVGGDGDAPLILTCEHASNRLPEPWTWPEEDRWVADTHWAWDIGARKLTEALADALGAVAVMPRFTRLLIDTNRPTDSDTLFRDVAEGRTLALNYRITEEDAARRIEGFYMPYHAAIRQQMEQRRPRFLLSVHSFTPLYEGQPREVEIGVLQTGEHALACRWRDVLARGGRDVRVDEPYTGAGGFMYSAWQHAKDFNCRSLELEYRQDIVGDDATHPELVRGVVEAIHDMDLFH